MKELLTELLPVFAEGSFNDETEFDIDGNILKVTISKEEDENKVTMVVEFIEDTFKKWVNVLDEDIFIEACEKFEDMTGKPLSNNVEEEDFKRVVKNIVANKIENLKRFI